MNPESPAFVRLSMGSAPAHLVYRDRAARQRDEAIRGERKQRLHDAAVARRRKRKHGGHR